MTEKMLTITQKVHLLDLDFFGAASHVAIRNLTAPLKTDRKRAYRLIKQLCKIAGVAINISSISCITTGCDINGRAVLVIVDEGKA